ncbi:hypothetical protein LC612_38920 [Nostoc sp. CHAB 5834]|nr:hypothetical protein [Nostoc sp. CHAB 5834]
MRYLKHRLAGSIDLTCVNIVEHDSSGHYEHIHLSWARGNPSCVDWSPVRWLGTKPKSEAAFKGVFGMQANAALEVLSCLGLHEQS